MKFLTHRWIHFLLLFAVLFAFVFVVGVESDLRQRIQFVVFDTYLKAYPRETTGDVVIADIDDTSVQQLAQWPWPRTLVADMIERLHDMGAAVIGFDGVLAEPDRTSQIRALESLPEEAALALDNVEGFVAQDNDQVLAERIKRIGNFVGAFSYGSNEERPRVVSPILAKKESRAYFLDHAQRFKNVVKFLPELEKNMAGNGSFMASAEIDSVLRRTSLLFTDGKQLYPSLISEVLRVSHGSHRPMAKLGPNKDFTGNEIDTAHRLIVGEYSIPVDYKGRLWVHYRKLNKERDYLPIRTLMKGGNEEELRKRLEGKIVLIGSSAEGLLDLRSTPLGLVPGVEVHANAIEQIVSGKYLIRPQIVKDAENNFILIVGLITILLAPFIGVGWLAVIFAGLTGGSFYLSHIGFTQYGVLVDPVYPAMAGMSIFMLSSILTYMRTEMEKKQVRQAFGLYISPTFMEELTKDPDKLKLGGEVRDLTVMFSDIRSFTTISESLTPEELIQLMNDFLTPMSDLVMSNRGTIDKYMGDAMMAFWNAPLDDPDHARHACLSALKMNDALVPINEAVKAKAESEGRTPVLLNAGIGINTGPCSVGNMGSRQRFAYSALGDAVNLASRLEGQTKTYGVNVLVGEETQKLVPDLAMMELDLIKVKGKEQPVRVFTLIGDEVKAQDEAFKRWQSCHNGMLAAYRAADFGCAAQDLKEAQEAADGQLDAYYKVYQERIIAMTKNPPQDDWDGVFVATSK